MLILLFIILIFCHLNGFLTDFKYYVNIKIIMSKNRPTGQAASARVQYNEQKIFVKSSQIKKAKD